MSGISKVIVTWACAAVMLAPLVRAQDAAQPAPFKTEEIEQLVAPIGELVDIMDVGFTCAYLATPYARRLSGETLYVDGGVNIMA